MSDRDRVAVVRSFVELESLASEWDVLAGSTGLPMLSYDWVLACASTLYREGQLHFITVRTQDVLTGVAPLVEVHRAGIKRLELVGGAILAEPSGLLYRSDDALDLLAKDIVGARMPVLLSRIPAHSPISVSLGSAARWRGMVVATSVVGAVAVPITCSWEEYLARLPQRRRYDLRRARRRAEAAGVVAFRMHHPAPDEVERLFADLVRIEAAGWKFRNGSSLLQRHGLRRFFLEYALRASSAGILRISFLDVGGEPVAAQLSIEYADRLWVLKIGYDESWGRCSPGWQLLAETMRYAFERKLKSYEFLGSDEPWLQGWITEARRCSTLACYPATSQGMYGLVSDTFGRLRARVSGRS